MAEAMKDKVENGKMINNYEYSYGEVIDYIYANGYFYTNTSSEDYGEEIWYSVDANGDIFAIKIDSDGNVIRMTEYNDSISLANLGGYMFNSPLAADTYYYGLEELIAGLWEFGKDDFNGDLESSVEDGVYAFSYGYMYDETFFVVNVDFTLSDEYYIENANVSVVAYDSYKTIPGATEDDEPTYSVIAEETAYNRINYTFAQNVEVENPYPADEVLASSFKIVDADGNELGSSLTAENGETIYLYLAEILPETAILDFTEVNATGEAADNYRVFVSVTEDEDGKWAISVRSYNVGAHEVTLVVNGVEKTFTLNVEAAVPTDIIVNTYEEREETDWSGNPFFIYAPVAAPSEITVWAGAPVILSGAANKGDVTDCIVTVNGAEATLEEVETTDGWVYVLILDTDVAGEYEVVFTAEADETLTETVNVTVKAVPEASELLDGKYVYTVDSVNIWSVVFGWDSTMTITYLSYNDVAEVWEEYSAEYTYEWVDNNLVTTFERGYEFDEQVIVNEATDYKLELDGMALVKETAENAFVGDWVYNIYNEDWTEVIGQYILTFNADGTGVFKADGVEFYFTYTLGEFDEEYWNYPITITADENATNVGETTAFGAGAIVTYTYDPSYMSMYVEYGEDADGNAVGYGYTKATVETVTGYVWPTELDTSYPTNIYNGTFEDGILPEYVELVLNASAAGTYTIYVCDAMTNAPITALNVVSFEIGGANIVGAVVFELEEGDRIVIKMNLLAEELDVYVFVDFVEAEVEEDPELGGDETVTGSALTVTTDAQQSSNQGEYTYTIDADGNITIYKNGVVADISEEYSLNFKDGVLTVLYGTDYAKTMTKYNGDAGVLEGSWKYATEHMTMYDFTFAAPAAGDDEGGAGEATGLEGTYNMVDEFGNTIVVTIDGTTISFTLPMAEEATVYNYTYADGTASYTNALGVAVTMPEMFSLSITDGAVVGMTNNGTDYNVVAAGDGEGGAGEATGLEGTYNMVDEFGNTIVVTIDGTTISFTLPMAEEATVYNYTYADGTASYTNALGVAVTMPEMFSLSITDGAVVGMTNNGTDYNVVA